MAFRRVGGVEDIDVSVRIIAATNRDLARAVESGAFRQDLYFRLKVVPIGLPPLRDRPEDLPVLVEHFLAEFSAAFGKRFRGVSRDALVALHAYRWPGNIRELRNLMERAVLLHEGETLEADMLQVPGGPGGPADPGASPILGAIREIQEKGIPDDGVDFERLVGSVERWLLTKAAERADWNQTQAARYLRLNRDKLRTRMKNYRLRRPGGGERD
jgi:DNA-binding NtrC family response regulator